MFLSYNPNIKNFGVEPINSDVMSRSLKSGKVESFDTVKIKLLLIPCSSFFWKDHT